MWLTAGLFHRVVDDRPQLLADLRQLLAGGDVLSPDHVRRALRALPTDAVLINGYGPTEGTTFTCVHRMAPGETVDEPVPIGGPISGTRVYVLDPDGALCPVGVPGELWIGGDGVALGYVADPVLTAERFRPDPYQDEPTTRMYRSGDRVRWRDDGTLEFIGRRDRQLKIRGFRVEPGEIETALRGHPDVLDVHVATFRRPGADRVLVAHVVVAPGAAPSDSELRAHAGSLLPAYAVPTAWTRIDALPLTPNGKLDAAALPTPQFGADHVRAGRLAMLESIERRMIPIWERVLAVDGVGPDDDFFDLGGHSLLAVEMFDAIERVFGRQLPLSTIFESPTVSGLAAALREDGWGRSRRSLVTITATGTRPPLFFVSAGDGNSVGFGALARRLGPDQPFHAFQPRGINGRGRLHFTVNAMAEHYLRLVRRVSRRGPYLLGGRCLGAVVAFEMARLLELRGERVALLAVLDSGGPQRWQPRTLADGTPFDEVMNAAVRRSLPSYDIFSAEGSARLLQWLAAPAVDGSPVTRYLYELYRMRPDVRDVFPDLAGADSERFCQWAWSQGRREHELCESLLPPSTAAIASLASAEVPSAATSRPPAESRGGWLRRQLADTLRTERRVGAAAQRRERIRVASQAAWSSYRAGPYGGVITLIRSEEYRVQSDLDQWYGIDSAGVLEAHVQGTHRSMLREPDVAGLAACIARLAKEACEAWR